MAKKKRKKRPRQGPSPAKQQTAVAAGRSGRGGKGTATAATAQETRPARAPARPQPSARSTDRRERKEEARRARERAVRRYQRRRLLRRGLVVTGVVGAVVLAVLFFQRQNKVANATIAAGDRAAEAAKCSSVKDEPLDPSYNVPHLTPGEPAPNYNTNPPTSGRHNPSPLPPSPHVYQEEVPATQAVHNLEHGYVVMYYRKSGKEKLPAPVIAALERYANGQKKVLLAPLDSLEEGTSYALTAWTHLQECPGAVTSNQVVAIAKGFVQRFRGSSSVPEPNGA